MAEDLFARLSAIGDIIGGRGATTFADLPDEDEEEEGGHEGHAHEAAPAPTKPTGFTGGTMTEARKASGGPTPGAVALQDHLLGRFTDSTSSGGIYANRNVRGGTSLSVHAEGRAGDVMVPVVAGGHASGNTIAAYLEQNADNFGIQRLIWNGRSWNRRTRKWVAYNGQNPHRDHVHWEITPEAAARPDLYAGGGQAPGKAAAPIGSGTATNTDDLFSRISAISGLITGKATPAQASKQRSQQGFKDVSKDMAQRFAKARGGKSMAMAPAAKTATANFASGNAGEYQRYAVSRFSDFGWSEDEAGALIDLWQRESGWNPKAQNPTSTAYGIAQFLNSTWQGVGASKSADPRAQIDAGMRYVKQRYGSPRAALAFWMKNHWY